MVLDLEEGGKYVKHDICLGLHMYQTGAEQMSINMEISDGNSNVVLLIITICGAAQTRHRVFAPLGARLTFPFH